MSWYNREYKYSLIQKFALNVLKQGVLPKHVAFIMDGNRRFAANRGLQKSEGHRSGFSKLTETITWCHDLGINEVSVYAFSIENFKRPESEVNFLMNLAAEKFQEFIDKNDELTEHGVCVRVIGNLSLLPPEVRRLAAQVMLLTRHNTKATLNILLAYTTRDELTHAVESIRLGVQEGVIRKDDISPDVISRCCYLRASQPVDVIVRTSGEVRLSDFMVWQAVESSAVFCFFKTFWPAFTFWHLVAAILRFQFNRMMLQTQSSDSCAALTDNNIPYFDSMEKPSFGADQRLTTFFDLVEERELSALKNHANSSCPVGGDDRISH